MSNSLATPGTVAHQAPLSIDFPGKNTGVGCHSLLLRDLPNPGLEPRSPALKADFLLCELPVKPLMCHICVYNINDNFKLFFGWYRWATTLFHHDVFYRSLNSLWNQTFRSQISD